MKKLISVALALVLLVSIVPLDVFASDYRDLSTSQAMIDIIKDYEGFHPKPYWDNSQYTVGYGTCCGYTYDEIPEDILDGITEAEGEQMLREYLAEDAEPSVNEMFESMGLQPTQNQFDAMVDFTYNFGAYWWQYEDTRVEAAIASGISDIELCRALGAWCRSGSSILPALCARRMREAIVYLYGEYSLPYGNVDSDLSVISNWDLPYFKYVIYDGNGVGISPSGYTNTVDYYMAGLPYGSLLQPSCSGATFAGWYLENGQQLTGSSIVKKNVEVYAEWSSLPFVDVPSGAWYTPCVAYCYEHGLMNGISSTKFSPDAYVTRGMIVTVLYRMAGSPTVSGVTDFPDVRRGEFYSDAVAWAVENGITRGYGDGYFRPDQNVSRAEMVTFMYRYANNVAGIDTSGGRSLSGFKDANRIPDYAVDAFEWALDSGLISGTSSTTLSPTVSASRCQLAKVLMNLDQMC